MTDYGFVVVHVPHSSLEIPDKYRRGILLDNQELNNELNYITDAYCDELYDDPRFQNRVVAKYSRLVCDVERFRDDKAEANAKRGFGLMYTKTSRGKPLRAHDQDLRNTILKEIYDPHHNDLTLLVETALRKYGYCLIIDGHSFNSSMIVKFDNLFSLPDFDIGTDPYHSPKPLAKALAAKVRELGYKPRFNSPFAGSMTPMKYYKNNKNVMSIMIETNRKLYMDETNGEKSGDFDKTKETCRRLMYCAAETALDYWQKNKD